MPLTRSDHKRIALSVAAELKKVLSSHNGERVMAKHKARTAPKAPPPPATGEVEPDADDLESALAAPAGEEPEPEEVAAPGVASPKAKPPRRGFPPHRG